MAGKPYRYVGREPAPDALGGAGSCRRMALRQRCGSAGTDALLPANELTVPVLLADPAKRRQFDRRTGGRRHRRNPCPPPDGISGIASVSLPVPLPHPLRHHASHCPARNRQPTLDATRGGTAAGGRHRAVPAPLRAAGIALMTPKRDGLSPGQFRPFFVFGQLYILLTLIYFRAARHGTAHRSGSD